MEWAIMLLGLTLVMILVLRNASCSKERERTAQTRTAVRPRPPVNAKPRRHNYTYDQLLQLFELRYPLLTPSNITPQDLTRPGYPATTPSFFTRHSPRNDEAKQKTLINNWRKSIAGLVRLADQNLRLAKQHMMAQKTDEAIQTAATSVENITHAVIHCYGGKPDTDQGQEEALRLLRVRLDGDESEEFEKAIRDVALVDMAARVNKQTPQSSERDAEQLLDTASRITMLFKRHLTDHFATEIPELGDKCPKCQSLDISRWLSNQHTVNVECHTCNHKWNEDNN
jgi:hypothetical protein